MNITIIIMILGSLGFILLGIFLLNNKYVKSIDVNDKELYKEVKGMKFSGYINLLIGGIGIVCSLICLITNSINRGVVAIFSLSIAVLSSIQYILNKKIRK